MRELFYCFGFFISDSVAPVSTVSRIVLVPASNDAVIEELAVLHAVVIVLNVEGTFK